MEKKRIFTFLLALVMLLSISGVSGMAALAEEPAAVELSDVDSQLSLIHSKLNDMMQKDSKLTWYYAVTDLDHDGNLEFVAATLHPVDRSTNLKVWEVSGDRSSLTACELKKDPEESFPDIMTDMTDTFHDKETDTWYYLVYDNIVISDTEVYTIKTAVNMKDGLISYDAYAIEHTVLQNSYRNVSYTDYNGIAISPEQYNAAGINAFAGADRSNTAFEWLTADDAQSLIRLTDSFMVFSGKKEPTETFPVPKPSAMQHPAATPVPNATPAPAATPVLAQNQQVWLMITKNPTNESKKVGGTALFVACANAYESLYWTIVGPDGGEYSIANFRYMCPTAVISGENSTTLSIANLSADMNGWGAYCTFYYQGQTASTTTAYMYVGGSTPAPAPSRDGTVYYGSVTAWNYAGVSVNLDGRTEVAIPWDICVLNGDIYAGAIATVYWNGSTVTYCEINGSQPEPQPAYGSMSGTAYHDTAFTIYVVLQNGKGYHLNGNLVNIIGGNEIDGAACTVYYVGQPSESSIYQIDVYGYNTYDYNYNPGAVIIDQDGGFDGGWAGMNYDNGFDGGWAGMNYDDGFDGGWAGMNYDDNDFYSDPNYDPIGDEHHRVTCPVCGNHFSPGEIACPVCGWAG